MKANTEIEVQDIDHLGIIAGVVDEIGIVEIIDELVGSHEQEKVSAGQVVKGLILNCMGFLSSPLYLFSQFFEGKATEHLIGEGVKPEHLNDTRIGRVLDKLYKHGVTEVFMTIALEVVKKYQIRLKSAHIDSTSLSVEGKYIDPEELTEEDSGEENQGRENGRELRSILEEEPVAIKITHGYSKDGRGDLKQYLLKLITTEDGDIPLFLQLGDGNEVDKTSFVPMIQEFQQQWSEAEPEVFVGDSALYSKDNIQALGHTPWITLVPGTNTMVKNLMEGLPPEQFVASDVEGYKYVEVCTNYGNIRQRWWVFESEKRKESDFKKLEGHLDKVFLQQSQILHKLEHKEFACEADALAAADDFGKTLKYHALSSIHIIPKPHYSQRGRPGKHASPSHYTYHLQATLSPHEANIELRRQQTGRFVLATNLLDHELWTHESILRTYKAQQCCERGFRFIKDPLFFASSVFLKTPRRIMALTMIMALCLMVYTLGQRQLRQALAQAQSTLPNQKGKPTSQPTLRWIFQCFLSVHLVWIDGVKSLLKLNPRQQLIFPFLAPESQKYYLLG